MISALPLFSAASDDELMEGNGKDFANRLQQRASDYAIALYDPEGWILQPIDPEIYKEKLIFYLRRRSWAEWYFGTVTPARQILLLDRGERATALRLARQIQDEVRHHDVFGASARRLGGEWRVERFPEPPNLESMRAAQEAAQSAGELAAANQLAGEVVLMIQGQAAGNVLNSLVPDWVRDVVVDIETDEPAHVELGHDLVAMHAGKPTSRRAMAAVQERFLCALGMQHTSELEQLGAVRHRALPELGAQRGSGTAPG